MKETVSSPRDLLRDQLADLHSMERQVLRHLSDLVSATEETELGDLLKSHIERTGRNGKIVSGLCSRLGGIRRSDACKAIAGLIEGGGEHIAAVKDPPVRALMIIAHCLRIESYGLAAYDIASRLAGQLGMTDEATDLLGILSEKRSVAESLLAIEPRLFARADRRHDTPLP